MTHIHYRRGEVLTNVMYDIDRSIFIVNSAYTRFDGEPALESSEPTRPFFLRLLLIHANNLYRAGDIDKGNKLLSAVMEIALAFGDILPEDALRRVIMERNLQLNGDKKEE